MLIINFPKSEKEKYLMQGYLTFVISIWKISITERNLELDDINLI